MNLRNTFLCVTFTLGATALLAAQGPPAATAPTGAGAQAQGGATGGGRGGRGGGGGSAYPQHAQADPDTIARGQQAFSTNCSFCHGSDARGGEGGPNLLRSQVVMDDQNGEGIAVVVQNGRPEMGMPKFDLTTAQIAEIAGYLHSLRVAGYDISRNIPPSILVGDAKAGEAYFSGVGKCNTCHSVTGDLAGIGAKMDPKAIQNALVSGRAGRGGFGGAAAPVTTVSVTLAGGKVADGKLDHLDDFMVSLTDADGNHMSFARNGDVPKIVVHNPLQAHLDMLKTFSDSDIHNLTAYLVTLK